MSGHSKWSTIKNKKGKADAARGKVFTKLARAISVAAKEAGPDPELNAKLRDAITKAKGNNMPNDNIDRAIKKGAGELGGNNYETITYEGYGPAGVAVILEALTDNKNRTAADVRHAFDKNGGNLGTSGCVSFMFEKKGQIMIAKTSDIDEDELMMLALDAGAEDMLVEEEGYEVITDVDNFQAVVDALENANYKFEFSEITMIPNTFTKLSPDDGKRMQKMLDMFEDNEDLQDVYHNWDEE